MFLGVAKAWPPILGVSGFLTLYALGLGMGIAVSLRWVRPMLMPPQGADAAKAARQRARSTPAEGLMDDDLTPLAG
jgi:hypothetical protein